MQCAESIYNTRNNNNPMQGLDYNTNREKLGMPEYGRGIYTMVQHALTLEDREQRQICAQRIVDTMRLMHPELKQQPDSEHKLWDHLALMADFQLDIDYPFDISDAKASMQRPNPLPYPDKTIRIKHYGALVFQMIDRVMEMEDGPERDALLSLTANQMKRDLLQWGHTSSAEERVIDDLARFSDGKIQLDPNFKFERVQLPGNDKPQKRKKR